MILYSGRRSQLDNAQAPMAKCSAVALAEKMRCGVRAMSGQIAQLAFVQPRSAALSWSLVLRARLASLLQDFELGTCT